MNRDAYKITVETERGRMTEREGRDALERGAKRLQSIQEMNGGGAGSSVEQHRRDLEKHANEDLRKGKV